MRKKLFFQLLFLSLLASLYAHPPSAPSGGVVEQQLKKEYEEEPLELKREVPTMQIEMPKKRLELPKGTKVFIKKLEIRGNKSVKTEEICSWVNCQPNREFSNEDIYNICHLIDEGYAEKGYVLARAYPPEQKINRGILVIEVIEKI